MNPFDNELDALLRDHNRRQELIYATCEGSDRVLALRDNHRLWEDTMEALRALFMEPAAYPFRLRFSRGRGDE